jgi:hypothetical protein
MKVEFFKLYQAVMFGFEYEWEVGSISIYFLFWELYIEFGKNSKSRK